jgi:2-polyprenyl-3-methyl-5-hydroxy-6-metoxy-1,4-benzoquinol methylase
MRPSADTLLVWTGPSCSYGCTTCPITADAAPSGVDPAALERQLADIPVRAGRLVVLLGGEPALRPDFLRLIAVIRAAGCVPGLVTTGRPLVYPQWRERLQRAGVAYVRVQFFGCGEDHDRIAQVAGAYEQAVGGVNAWLAEAGTQCDVDVVLNFRRRSTDPVFSEVKKLAQAMPSAAIQIIIAVEREAGASNELTAAQRRSLTALATWARDSTRPMVTWQALPDSISPAPGLSIAPLRPTFVGAEPPASCLGSTAVLAGETEPLNTRANSFNYLRQELTLPWVGDPDMCTAFSSVPNVDPLRNLWLVENERLVLHTTDTGDFAPAEIAQVKQTWSHLFIDRAAPGVLDDFMEGMRRVVPEPTCQSCSHQDQCGRRFRMIDEPPFAREEAWIAHHMTQLQGRVLDVGCGEQLYRDQLAPLVSAGTVHYTGLDPDEPSIARIRAALPQGRFFLTGIEDFRDDAASYDHVICLRSLNHVFDVDEALARMTMLLKPGGRILIVETTPFAMLRRAEQVTAADQAPRAGHQHFRNVTSEDVLPLARRRGLHVLEHQPASLAGSNEWILLLQRSQA